MIHPSFSFTISLRFCAFYSSPLCVFRVFIQYYWILAAPFANILVSSASSTSPTFLFFREFCSFLSIPLLSTSTIAKTKHLLSCSPSSFHDFIYLDHCSSLFLCYLLLRPFFGRFSCFFFFIGLESSINTCFLSFSLTARLIIINRFSKSSYLFCFVALNVKS